jgi:hypothetical protein
VYTPARRCHRRFREEATASTHETILVPYAYAPVWKTASVAKPRRVRLSSQKASLKPVFEDTNPPSQRLHLNFAIHGLQGDLFPD